MLNKIINKIRFLVSLAIFTIIATGSAHANEITAIDFNGEIIGRVIPDGSVIGLKNEIIGNITADSFIIDSNGKIIGGVVPQGVAISNDNKLLGKVNNDGSVRLPTGKIIGKVLPNALVVDDNYNIIGAVLYPGLIYNDDGKTIGRLTGDGYYVSMEGQNIGFVSPTGYAYKNNGAGYALDGKLISSKMVISSKGDFIGSVAPGGKVTDFNAKNIGSVHANGYVYADNLEIIGKIVSSGYAFDNLGNYIGLITYNGEVVHNNQVVGKLRADDKIINKEGENIGWYVDISATATDFSGKYLGRLMPNGEIARAKDIVGKIGARGVVYNKDGLAVGQISLVGPIFDYMGNLTALALRNGTAISTSGTVLGYMKSDVAYDNIGRILGSIVNTSQVITTSNEILGLSGIGSSFKASNVPYKISPFGYVYSSDNIVIGNTLTLDNLYKESGEISGYIGINGNVEGYPVEKGVKLNQYGMIIDSTNDILGYKIDPFYAIDTNGDPLGRLTQNNLITDNSGKVISKIVPEFLSVESSDKVSDNYMPVTGFVGENYLAVGFNGNMLGYVRANGDVYDYQSNRVGSVEEGNLIVGIDKSVIGKVVGYKSAVNEACEFMGITTPKGDLRNARDVVIGRVLPNMQVVSDMGTVNGFIPEEGIVADFEGKNLGTVNTFGRVLDYGKSNIGCIKSNGRLYSSDNKFEAAVVKPSIIMNFNNSVVGRILKNGKAVDKNNKIIGYVLPNGNVVSTDGKKVLGVAFRYRFAFDKDNNFMGRINNNAEVVSKENKVLAKVNYDGTVVSDKKDIGYALYDVYVYNENNQAIGYLTKGGTVTGFAGNKIGVADRGFLVDNNYNLIGRGARDYFIRNSSHEIVGELLLDGSVIDNTSSVFGKVSGSGEIRNDKGKLLAKARYLQYYNPQRLILKQQEKQQEGPQIQVGGLSTPENIESFDNEDQYIDRETKDMTGKYGLKAIGIAVTPDGNYLGDILSNNDVINKLGELIGTRTPDGLIIGKDGSLEGIEDIKTTSADKMFMPGDKGDGGAYGIGSMPTNLGAGGGYGAGERYDPVRAQILDVNQNIRRSEYAVGKISTGHSKEAFDGMQANWEESRELSTWRVDMSEMILADKPIPAVLARSIMSGASEVPVTAIVERNVYAEVGRNIVIPAGSRLIGNMGSLDSGGQGAIRVNISWQRLIRPDGSAFKFEGQTGDAQGRSGALGYIDEQLAKKYALPLATQALTDFTAFFVAAGENTSDGNGGTTQDSKSEAASDARQNFLNGMEQIFNQILQDKTSIEAVAYVPAGTRLIIYPKIDLWIRTADREKEEETAKASSTGPLIIGDESEPSNKKDKSTTSGGGSTSSKVEVYGGTDSDAQPTGGGLLDEEPQNTRKTPQRMPAYAATPPPSANITPPPSADAGGATLF